MNALEGFVTPRRAQASRCVFRHCVAMFALGGALAGCDRATPPASVATAADPEISWARDALSRNPTLEVLATDANARVFTVRMKASGEVRAVKLADLAAAPVSELATAAQVTHGAATDDAAPPNAAAPTSPAMTPPSTAPSVSPRATAATARAPDEASAAQDSEPAKNYTIERAGGQVKVSGPGVSIVSAGTKGGSGGGNAGEQRSAEPVICEGQRMLHLDNRVINALGNAVIARGGCELYITNSRITAAGTAVIAQDAVVHIANSTIEGSTASFDADDRAKLFLRSSTFKGLPRRGERAVIQDQGGNQWR